MALWDRVRTMLAIDPAIQERAIDSFVDHPGLTEQLAAIQGLAPRPWRVAGLREALGVPAIFGAVNLIANTVGSMSMKAYVGELEVPPADRPRIIVRPDPFQTAREFYRQTAYNIATRGEAWWWIAARDADGIAMSVLSINPAEVMVTENADDLRYPVITWRSKTMKNEDMRQLVYSRDPGSLRGEGPLQICGAAISVAVEAQEWAANHFASGGNPSVVIKSAVEVDADEAETIKQQWVGSAYGNMPKVIDPGIEDVKEMGANAAAAQMLEARGYQNVDIATMFGMNATLLNAAIQGSALTYQNVGTKFEDFLRTCLRPNYLESIEQTMSDLLTRSTTCRFNTDFLTLADIKTRYDVYDIGIKSGIIDQEEARRFEGLAPGDVENAAVPQSAPAAIPGRLPIQMRSEPRIIRCDGTRLLRGRLAPCGKRLSDTGSFIGRCPRCHKEHRVAA
jgi:HK97 family phage portal protein